MNKEASGSEDVDGGDNVHLRLMEENIMGDELKDAEEVNEYDTRSEVSSSSSDSSSMSRMSSSSSESDHEPGELNYHHCILYAKWFLMLVLNLPMKSQI